MKVHSRETFTDLELRRGGVISDQNFERCVFDGCQVRGGKGPNGVLRHIEARKCKLKRVPVYFVTLEDVLIEDFASGGGLLLVVDCLFKHVTLRGKFDKLFIHPSDNPQSAAAKYYAKVDWALDIRDAHFEQIDLRGVPSALVRRNPDEQIVVTRTDAMRDRRWEKLPHRIWKSAIRRISEPRLFRDEVFLIAESRSKHYDEQRAAARMLHDLGLAK